MSGMWASGPSRRRSVGESTKDRRPRLKALAADSAQERRRQEFISNQKRARRNLSDHARLLAALPSEEAEATDTGEYQHHHHQPQAEGYDYGFPTAEGGRVESSITGHEGAGGEAGAGGGDTAGGWAEEVEMAIDDGQVHEKAPHHVGDATAGVSASGPASSNNSSTGARGGGQGGGRGKGKRGAGGSGGAAQRAIRRRDHWANQLCTPEWMLTVPSDLNGAGSTVGAGWYVMARPEGKRVLVISAKGETVARQMCGAITHRFSSNLPGGSSTTAGRRGGSKGGGGYCILDCVFHELDQTFSVLDMMAWKGYPLYDCNTDFRFYWVRTKLLEADGPLDTVTSRNAYRIKPTPYHECDRQGLAHAYASPVPFIKDGLLFYLKTAHYQLGPTPLVLLWKDASVARYLGIQSDQAVVLKVVGDRSSAESEEERELSRGGETDAGSADHSNNPRTVSLLDGPHKGAFAATGTGGDQRDGGGGGAAKYPLMTADGVCVGEVGPEGSPTYVPQQAKANDLLRFKLTGAEEELLAQSAGGTAAMEAAAATGGGGGALRGSVQGLRFDKRCSKLRPMADTWSKVLFQSRLRRNGGVSIEEIDAKAKCAITPSIGPQEGQGDEQHAEEDGDDDEML
ncbi:unnamed protein product [Ectocarpus sp. 6 AP-2014]